MRLPKGKACYTCAPQAFRHTPDITGDHHVDAAIVHSTNKSLPSKLSMYILTDEPGYGPRTAYNGYSGYSGDE